jgi:hypothetical protein
MWRSRKMMKTRKKLHINLHPHRSSYGPWSPHFRLTSTIATNQVLRDIRQHLQSGKMHTSEDTPLLFDHQFVLFPQ